MSAETKPTKAAELVAAAQAAAEVRTYDTDPNVVAYRIERTRAWVDRLIWVGLILGLLFTMTNVQQFAAGDAKPGDLAWWSAWLLDPMVSLVLVGVLLGEQVAARYGVRAGGWVRATKWGALVMTYAMNTWEAWAVGDPAKILLHSVPVILVFGAAEAVTDLRHAITRTVRVALESMAAPIAERSPSGLVPIAEPIAEAVAAPIAERSPIDPEPIADAVAEEPEPIAEPVKKAPRKRAPKAIAPAPAPAASSLSTKDRARLALTANPGLSGAELGREVGVSDVRGRALRREIVAEAPADEPAAYLRAVE